MPTLLDYMPERVKALASAVERRVEEFLKETGAEWLYVDFSAGKDSSVVLAASLACCDDRVVATFLHLAGQTVRDNALAALRTAKHYGMTVYKYAPRSPRHLRKFMERDRPWENAPALVYVVTTAGGMDYWRATLKYGLEAPLERVGGGKRWACAKMKSAWLTARPENCTWDGQRARCVLTGVRKAESPYRARLWSGTLTRVFRSGKKVDVARAPIADLGESEVWALLRYYGIYSIIAPQYRAWERAPNCAICPLMGRRQLARAASQLPTGYLERVLAVLREIEGRYRKGTWTRDRLRMMIDVLEAELGRRRATRP